MYVHESSIKNRLLHKHACSCTVATCAAFFVHFIIFLDVHTRTFIRAPAVIIYAVTHLHTSQVKAIHAWTCVILHAVTRIFFIIANDYAHSNVSII